MPPLSPRTEYAMEGQQSPQDAEAMFEERFGEMAHNHLTTKFPSLADRVQMFTTLSTDLERDIGVGTFVIDVGGLEVHLPVVVESGQLSPLDIIYVKDFDTFIPLSEEWLRYLESETASSLGTEVKAPSTLQTDVDIRNLVVPPMTGRYSYASAPMDLMDVVGHAPNKTKRRFLRSLRKNEKIAIHVLEKYGRARLSVATAPSQEKKASLGQSPAVEFYDDTATLDMLKRAFDETLPGAYYAIRNRGYALVDRRPDAKLAYEREYIGRYTTSEHPGFYEVQLRDGDTRIAFVTSSPTRLGKNLPYAVSGTPTPRNMPEDGSRRKQSDKNEVFVFTDRGELLHSKDMAQPILGIKDGAMLEDTVQLKVFPSSKLGEPKEGRGFFLGLRNASLEVSEPVTVSSVTLRSNGMYFMKGRLGDGTAVVMRKGPDYTGNSIRVGDYGSSPEIRIPNNYRFVKETDRLEASMLVTSMREAKSVKEAQWLGAGASELVVRAKAGAYGIDSSIFSSRVKAAEYLILDKDLSEKSAENMLKMAELKGKSQALVLGRPQLLKMAQGEMPMPEGGPAMQDPSMQDSSMQDPSMMDPSMMDPSMMDPMMMDPAMMEAMMGPPPPSPLEQAAMEVSSVLESQTQELMQQMEQQGALLDAQVQAINSVLGRAQDISMGAPALEPTEIMQMGQSPMQATPVSGGPGMDPGMPMPEDAAMPPVGEGVLEDAIDVDGMSPESGAFDTSAVTSLMAEDGIEDLAMNQLPKFRESLDGIAKTLFEMRIKAPELKQEIGEKRYDEQTSKLKRVLTSLGSVLLSLYRNARILVPPEQQELEVQR